MDGIGQAIFVFSKPRVLLDVGQDHSSHLAISMARQSMWNARTLPLTSVINDFNSVLIVLLAVQ